MNSISIDSERRIGDVSPLLFGSFIEHLGRCVYGGIYQEKSPFSDAQGFRTDVLAAVRELAPTILRWPGGNFVSGYHWMDGVGPKELRPCVKNIAWGSCEPNHFGTDEYIDYCRLTDAEPFICTNMGTGTIEEARNWVEYCNAPTGTYFADLRAKHGHEQPFGVKYWGIGNEMNGPWQIGQLDALDYAKKAREAAKLMKWADPSIRTIVAGDCTDDPCCVDWDRTLLDYMAHETDCISIHMYARNWENNFAQFMATSQRIAHKINLTNALIDTAMHKTGKKERIKICFDEWNVFYREDSTANRGNLIEERYNFEDALVCAEFLNAFVNHCDTLETANQSALVNAVATIRTREDGLLLQTTFYPFYLFSHFVGKEAFDALVQCGSYDTPIYEGVPDLDVSVSRNGRDWSVFVVNKTQLPQSTSIRFFHEQIAPVGEVYEFYHDDMKAENTFEQPNVVGLQKRSLSGLSSCFSYEFPPHSLTLLRLEEIVQ